MIPTCPLVDELEKLAAAQEPSLEGSWWTTLQITEHILNNATKRDPVNNAMLESFLADCGDRLEEVLKEDCIRPIPYDDLMQLIDYCGIEVKHIIKNPTHKLVKVDKMVQQYRVQKTTSKTMNWMGKQPGRTIKEKLSGKNKILTQVNEYSFDTKENQVTALVLKQLLKKVQNRIDNGVEADGYDDKNLGNSIDKLLMLKKTYRNSNLADVKPQYHLQPNNVLLSDKHYSIIWKTYQKLSKYKGNLLKKWDNAFTNFQNCIFLALISELTSYENVSIFDERMLVYEENGEVRYIDGNETEINIVRFIIDKDSVRPVSMTLTLLQSGIKISIEAVPVNNKLQKQLSAVYLCEFSISEKKKVKHKRGVPFILKVSAEKHKKEYSIYADMKGVYEIINIINDIIEKNGEVKLEKRAKEEFSYKGTCIFDFAGTKPYITVNNEIIDYKRNNYVVKYLDKLGNSKVYFSARDNYYFGADKVNYISDAVNSERNTEALRFALEDLSNKVSLDIDDYLIYTVPDSLDEFAQKSIKQNIKLSFRKSFPVWRSVAAITDVIINGDSKFKNDDMFFVVDLSGEIATIGLMSVRYDSKLKDFVCNHFPPFPEEDEGELITERYFAKEYVKRYFEKNRLTAKADIISNIIEKGKIVELFETKSSIYEAYIENEQVCEICIEYDEMLYNECLKLWCKNYISFWNKVKYKVPRTKPINYVAIISNICLNDVKDIIDSIYSQDRSYSGIYLLENENVSKGAYAYQARIVNHLPTWTEYLPKLSLEVVKEGKFGLLDLIDNNISYDVMGENNESVVTEKLILRADENRREYKFPLIKEDISRRPLLLDACIKHDSFPLKETIAVELTVRYKYGFDNSYELVVKPFNIENPPFDEIIAEWSEREIVNLWPLPPSIIPDEKILILIEEVKDSFSRIQASIERHMVGYEGINDKSIPIKNTSRFLSTNIFKLRNITLSDCKEAKDYISGFIKSNLYVYLAQIAGVIRNSSKIPEDMSIPNAFFVHNSSIDLEYLQGDSLQILYTLGKYSPKGLQNYYVDNYFSFNEKYRMKALVDMMFLNYQNTDAIELLLKEVSVEDRRDYNIKMDGAIRELSKLCWFDPEIIYVIYSYCPGLISNIVEFITDGLMFLSRKRFKDKLGDKNFRQNVKRYVNYVEMLLAIMRLRNPEKIKGFNLLKVGSYEALQVVKHLRSADDNMEHPRSKLRFKLEKPEYLEKMTDLAYALELYLTGDKKANAIEVVSVEADD